MHIPEPPSASAVDHRRAEIENRLTAIEQDHQVHILLACESGSRAWGFASPDSDFDVRFLCVHPLPWYLRVHAGREVIEYPITDDLDINGWELRKALPLLAKDNATLHGLKKYLYVLRPLLATLWIERGLGLVPMRFVTLVEALIDDQDLRAAIDQLLALADCCDGE
ncbi:nucleotidyltransferase domain-containing protein [Thiorhodovibrio frisius]|uniref:Putative nucleotidyltransferase n=1 Tax=Thiorhodovibrio frisius TaxID=631362 RepID=H8Z1E5_9GAMM|nr:nucleotidyltransferase domain-containing protein [Thiorhodovibrio frisius]EIC22494.1 putative nucleotidyltransferase [Thiorhodovibrio frisius]WPL24794.1 putative nucleotidyltransferase [Thiorhodovibrio frisius]